MSKMNEKTIKSISFVKDGKVQGVFRVFQCVKECDHERKCLFLSNKNPEGELVCTFYVNIKQKLDGSGEFHQLVIPVEYRQVQVKGTIVEI